AAPARGPAGAAIAVPRRPGRCSRAPSSVLDQDDVAREDRRPLGALDLDGGVDDEPRTLVVCAGFDQRLAHAHPPADLNRRDEADAIVAVVEAPPALAHLEDLPLQGRNERQHEQPVRDGPAVGHVGSRAPDVDMDPVVVAGDPREIVDVALGDLDPGRGPEFLPLPVLQVDRPFNGQHSFLSAAPGRECAKSPHLHGNRRHDGATINTSSSVIPACGMGVAQTVTTILPICSLRSSMACACRISSKAKTLWMRVLIAPFSSSGHTFSTSSAAIWPLYSALRGRSVEPVSVSLRRTSWRVFTSEISARWLAISTNLPSKSSRSSCFCVYGPACPSRMTSNPLPPAAARICSGQ